MFSFHREANEDILRTLGGGAIPVLISIACVMKTGVCAEDEVL